MPSKLRVRYVFRPLVRLIAKGLNRIGLSPNGATFLMLVFSILSVIGLILFNNILLFGIFVFCCGIFDGVDGAIARLSKKATSYGGFLDSTMDRFSEFVIFLGILIYCWTEVLWTFIDMKLVIFIAFTSTIMISYTRARAEPIYHGDYDIGLMARSERLFYIFMISIIVFFFDNLNIFLFIYMWLVLGTFLFRGYNINKQIKAQANKL